MSQTPAPALAGGAGSASVRSPTSVLGSPLSERQVEQFSSTQKAVLAEDAAYLASFPELPALLAEFTKAVLVEKPSNLREFAKQYFARPVETGPS